MTDIENPLPNLLLVDDDRLICESLAFVLRKNFTVHSAATRDESRRVLRALPQIPNLALIDLGLPPTPHTPEEGFMLVRELLAFNPAIKILILSGQDKLENVRQALILGAVDFIAKPCDMALLKTRLQHQLRILDAEQYYAEQQQYYANQPYSRDFIDNKNQSQEECNTVDNSKAVETVQTQVRQFEECNMVGNSKAMETLRTQIRQFADLEFAVLVEGETGTGKELVAQCLHKQSKNAKKPCLTINCAAFTAELLESQLFGHAKGAFTGASVAKAGFFEEAGEGTLILDEIGEMPLQLQAKLLRVLENGEYYRLGETKVRQSTARIVAVSNRDLRKESQACRFRSDLYHRLCILNIKVPSMKERKEDSLLLLKHFQEFYKNMGTLFTLNEESHERWQSYDFPGNVRELRNIVIRLGAKYPNQLITKEQLNEELEM